MAPFLEQVHRLWPVMNSVGMADVSRMDVLPRNSPVSTCVESTSELGYCHGDDVASTAWAARHLLATPVSTWNADTPLSPDANMASPV